MLVKLRSVTEKCVSSTIGLHTEMHRLGFQITSEDISKYQSLKASLEKQAIYKHPIFKDHILEVLAKSDKNFPIPSTIEESLNLYSQSLKALESQKEAFATFLNLKDDKNLLPLKDVFNVLQDLKSPNYLGPSEYNKLISVSEKNIRSIFINLATKIDIFNLEQDVLYLQAIFGLQSTVKKFLVNDEILEIIKNIVEKHEGKALKEEFVPLFKLISTVKKIDKHKIISLKKLQTIFNGIFPEDCSFVKGNDELCDLFLSFNKETMGLKASKGIAENIIQNINEIPYKTVYEIIIKMEELGLEVPFNVIVKSEEIPFENFKILEFYKLLEIFSCFTRLKLFSLNSLQRFCICFCTYLNFEKSHTNEIIDAIYNLHKYQIFPILLNTDGINLGFLHNFESFSTSSQLKLSVCFLPHLNSQTALGKFFDKIQSGTLSNDEIESNINLFIELQYTILKMIEEGPIYSYQFNSYKIIDKPMLGLISESFNRFIAKMYPKHDVVFKYFTSHIAKTLPEEDLVSEVPEAECVDSWGKMLWQIKDEMRVSPEIVKNGIEIVLNSPTPNMETLYYLTSIIGKDSGVPVNKVAKGNFYLSILYNLQEKPNLSASELSSNLMYSQIPSEALVKTIIMLQKSKSASSLKYATPFLSYFETKSPNPSAELVRELLHSLHEANSPFLHFQAISSFFEKHYNNLDSQDHQILFNILEDYWENTSSNLKLKLQQAIDMKEINKLHLVTELDQIKKFLLEDKYNAVSPALIENMSKHKVFFSEKIKTLIKNIEKCQDQEDQLDTIKELLALNCETAGDPHVFDSLHNTITKLGLWNSLSFNDLLNYYTVGTAIHTMPDTFLTETKQLQHNFEKSLKNSIYSAIISPGAEEELQDSPLEGIKCFRNFKYLTELEPRQIISNDVKQRTEIAEIVTEPEMSTKEIQNLAKIIAIGNAYKFKIPEEIKKSLSMYYMKKENFEHFLSFDIQFKEILDKVLETSNKIIRVQRKYADTEVFWRGSYCEVDKKIMVFLDTEIDYYYTEKPGFELNFMQKVIRDQVKNLAGYKVVDCHWETWRQLGEEEKIGLVKSYFEE